ncbi:MAG: hypothetical protein ACOYYS_07485 [Chloroflexota bacterium]
MPENMRIWIEVLFNITYLAVVWGLVTAMLRRQNLLTEDDRPTGRRVMLAFALLALGDSGHVGFRVVAYWFGGLEAHPLLVGLGALSTAYTVTVFYMLLLDAWRVRFRKQAGWFAWVLIAAGIARLVVMAFPQNEWGMLVAPYTWSLLRNAFLVVQGLGVMFLILKDAFQTGDTTFQWIGWMIALSYTFYAPVILWSAQVPLLGMLMIPKTCAYVAIAFLAYRSLFFKQSIQAIAVHPT